MQKGIVKLVGFFHCADFVKPKETRTEHNVRVEFLGWHLKLFEELNEKQKKLSSWGLWNDALLKERLSNNWNFKIGIKSPSESF